MESLTVQVQNTVSAHGGESPARAHRGKLQRLSPVLGISVLLTLGTSLGQKPSEHVLGVISEFISTHLWLLAMLQAIVLAQVSRVILDLVRIRSQHSLGLDFDISLSDDEIARIEDDAPAFNAKESQFERICRRIDALISVLLVVALIVATSASLLRLILHMPRDTSLSDGTFASVRIVSVALLVVAISRILRAIAGLRTGPSLEELQLEVALREEQAQGRAAVARGFRKIIMPEEIRIEERLEKLRRRRRFFF